jgi:hypothetical protein
MNKADWHPYGGQVLVVVSIWILFQFWLWFDRRFYKQSYDQKVDSIKTKESSKVCIMKKEKEDSYLS